MHFDGWSFQPNAHWKTWQSRSHSAGMKTTHTSQSFNAVFTDHVQSTRKGNVLTLCVILFIGGGGESVHLRPQTVDPPRPRTRTVYPPPPQIEWQADVPKKGWLPEDEWPYSNRLEASLDRVTTFLPLARSCLASSASLH